MNNLKNYNCLIQKMLNNTEFGRTKKPNAKLLDIQQGMIYLFEKIIETQLNHIVENTEMTPLSVSPTDYPQQPFLEKTHSLQRDFRKIFISRNEYLRVCQKGGAFSLLYDCGSGSYTNWFLYNSNKRNRLYMVWVNQKNQNKADSQTINEQPFDGSFINAQSVYKKNEYLGVLKEHNTEETNNLYDFCLRQYLNNINKVFGGFRDDVNRITQL